MPGPLALLSRHEVGALCGGRRSSWVCAAGQVFGCSLVLARSGTAAIVRLYTETEKGLFTRLAFHTEIREQRQLT